MRRVAIDLLSVLSALAVLVSLERVSAAPPTRQTDTYGLAVRSRHRAANVELMFNDPPEPDVPPPEKTARSGRP